MFFGFFPVGKESKTCCRHSRRTGCENDNARMKPRSETEPHTGYKRLKKLGEFKAASFPLNTTEETLPRNLLKVPHYAPFQIFILQARLQWRQHSVCCKKPFIDVQEAASLALCLQSPVKMLCFSLYSWSVVSFTRLEGHKNKAAWGRLRGANTWLQEVSVRYKCPFWHHKGTDFRNCMFQRTLSV